MTAPTAPTAPTLLLVDDSPDNLQLLYALLKDHYRIKVAICGERALKLAMGNPPPDLILLDVMMPDMDGYTVCSTLKANPHTAGVPVLFVSARSRPEDEARAKSVGGIGLITKPIDPERVLASIAEVLASTPAMPAGAVA